MEPKVREESILVVDDAPDTLEILKRNLASQGFMVFTAPAVTEAIRILEANPVDLVGVFINTKTYKYLKLFLVMWYNPGIFSQWKERICPEIVRSLSRCLPQKNLSSYGLHVNIRHHIIMWFVQRSF